MLNKAQANFIAAVPYYQSKMCVLYANLGFIQYGNIIYSGAANAQLCQLDDLQSRIKQTCSFVFQLIFQHQHVAIMGLVCCLLAGEGRGNFPTYCPQLWDNSTHCRSHRLHFCDPAGHLCFVNPCNFRTLEH